jgi:hypothetical protein
MCGFSVMFDLSLDQILLIVIAFALVRLCLLVRDGVVFLAEMVEMMEEDDSDIYHPPYEIEDGGN